MLVRSLAREESTECSELTEWLRIDRIPRARRRMTKESMRSSETKQLKTLGLDLKTLNLIEKKIKKISNKRKIKEAEQEKGFLEVEP